MGVNIFMTTCHAQLCKGMLLIHLFRGSLLSTFCVSGMLLGTRPCTPSVDSLVYISQFLYTRVHVFEIIYYDFPKKEAPAFPTGFSI